MSLSNIIAVGLGSPSPKDVDLSCNRVRFTSAKYQIIFITFLYRLLLYCSFGDSMMMI